MFSQKLGSGSSAHSCALDLDGISRQQAVTSREKDGRFDNRPLPNADIRRSKWQVGRMLVVAGCQRSLSCMLPGTVAQKGGRKLCRKVSRWHCFSVPFFTPLLESLMEPNAKPSTASEILPPQSHRR